MTRYTRKTLVPTGLRSIIGEDYFHDVTWVRIEGGWFGDLELAVPAPLDRIETLGIVETAITDAGLRHLRGRTAIKGLFLGGNQIGDTGIDLLDLASLPQLSTLELCSTLVSDSKLAEIKRRFPKLDVLADEPSHRVCAGSGPWERSACERPRSGPSLCAEASLPEGRQRPIAPVGSKRGIPRIMVGVDSQARDDRGRERGEPAMRESKGRGNCSPPIGDRRCSKFAVVLWQEPVFGVALIHGLVRR